MPAEPLGPATLPDFETERLSLRARSTADLEACLAMDRDTEVTRYVAGPWDDPAAHERFVRERIRRFWGDGLGYWSIFPNGQPGHFLGWIMLIPVDGVGPEIEIGWRLNREAWGRGYATEAALPVVRHAFETVGIDRIVADIDRRNANSIRVAEKIGMRATAGERHGTLRSISFAMTLDDYRTGRRFI